ncbi:uncharacterized protein LOC120145944 [Hibiscus syriacus]|uniref:uncharacterized protein LOC120145944 n=1 Tax=Hibiscus syriacus TaxID=106335 RepID=UPI001924613C|nr:uncharacterized protein LOC120145944 [Hibiscus syriacus]
MTWANESRVADVQQFMQERDNINSILLDQLTKAQHCMKYYTNRHRSDREFKEGEEVYLKLQPYKQTSLALPMNLKLSARFYGPNKIKKRIGSVAYQLELPVHSKLHPVFHISLLKRKIGDKNVASRDPPELTADAGGIVMNQEVKLEADEEKGGNMGKLGIIIGNLDDKHMDKVEMLPDGQRTERGLLKHETRLLLDQEMASPITCIQQMKTEMVKESMLLEK